MYTTLCELSYMIMFSSVILIDNALLNLSKKLIWDSFAWWEERKDLDVALYVQELMVLAPTIRRVVIMFDAAWELSFLKFLEQIKAFQTMLMQVEW